MTAPTPKQLERLVVMAEDNDPEIILSNLSEFALDGNSAHAQAVLMAEAAIILSAALRELDQARQVLADAWQKGVETALNHAIRNDDSVTLRLEHLDGTPWKNPYRDEATA